MESESKMSMSLTVEDVVELLRTGEGLPKDFRNNGKNAFTAFAKTQPGRPVVELYRDVDGYVDGLTKRELVPSSICNYLDYLKTGLKHLEAIRNLFSEEEATQLTLQIAAKAKGIRSAMHREKQQRSTKRSGSNRVAVVKEDATEAGDYTSSGSDVVTEEEEDASAKGDQQQESQLDKLLDTIAGMEKSLGQCLSEKEDATRRIADLTAEKGRLCRKIDALTQSNKMLLNFIHKVPGFCEKDSISQSLATSMCNYVMESLPTIPADSTTD
jgi:hypothetical protein